MDFQFAGFVVAALIVTLLVLAWRLRRNYPARAVINAALPRADAAVNKVCVADQDNPSAGVRTWPILLAVAESPAAVAVGIHLRNALQAEFDGLQTVLGAAGLRPVVGQVSGVAAGVVAPGAISPSRLQITDHGEGGLGASLLDPARAMRPADLGLPVSCELGSGGGRQDAVHLVAMLLAHRAAELQTDQRAGADTAAAHDLGPNARALLLDAAAGSLARAELEGQRFPTGVKILSCWCAAERARLDDDDGAIADAVARLRAVLAPPAAMPPPMAGLRPEQEGAAAADLADLLERHARASDRPHAVLLEAVDWAERSQDLLEPIARPQARAELAVLRARLLTRLAVREQQPRYLAQARGWLEAARSVWRPDSAPGDWLRATLALGETVLLDAEMSGAGSTEAATPDARQACKRAGELFASALALPESAGQTEPLARAQCGLGWCLLLQEGELGRADRLRQAEAHFQGALAVASGPMPAELRGNLRLGLALVQARRSGGGYLAGQQAAADPAAGNPAWSADCVERYESALENFELAFALSGDAIPPARQALVARDASRALSRITAVSAGRSAAVSRDPQLAARTVRLLETIAADVASGTPNQSQLQGPVAAVAQRGLGDALMALAAVERDASLGARAIAAYQLARSAVVSAGWRETLEAELALARAHRLVHEAGPQRLGNGEAAALSTDLPASAAASHFLAARQGYQAALDALKSDPMPLTLGGVTAECAEMLALEGKSRDAADLLDEAAEGFEQALALLRNRSAQAALTSLRAKLAQVRVASARLQRTPPHLAAARKALLAAYDAAIACGQQQQADDARRELDTLDS